MPNFSAFVGGSYTARAGTNAHERTLNWYVEEARREHASAKQSRVLMPTPGVDLVVTASGNPGPGRGIFKFEDRVFCVIGPTLYELDATFTLTNRGNVLSDGEPATAAWNGDLNNEFVLTSNGTLYQYDLSTDTLTAVGTMTANGVRMVDYLDGYFFALLPDTSTIRLSDLGDGSTWNVLRIRERSLAADRWQAI